ncbi:hypothetical protein LTV02_35230 [Nocardia yamanashiensis]|uniref:hypothetical protein n=1 Tax=Nocardia yamanashiensis TaxID=209247 RepID=UPI001E2D4636|nr:hypothetical protein [Nocardia yamanashiensis]UGT41146.1 hypothetical protein LTV02_35230 [Nocardia yamanashiensis]
MSLDWTSVAVSATTATATLGGAALTQFFGIRSKRVDARLQSAVRAEERAETARKEELSEKRSCHAALNTSVHYFRAVARRYLARKGTPDADVTKLEAAWEALRENYAHAQMVLSDRALDVASEVTRYVEVGHRDVLDVDPADADRVARIEGFLADDMGAAVRLLRRALREDLGIAPPAEVDIDARLVDLRAARRSYQGSPAPRRPARPDHW